MLCICSPYKVWLCCLTLPPHVEAPPLWHALKVDSIQAAVKAQRDTATTHSNEMTWLREEVRDCNVAMLAQDQKLRSIQECMEKCQEDLLRTTDSKCLEMDELKANITVEQDEVWVGCQRFLFFVQFMR